MLLTLPFAVRAWPSSLRDLRRAAAETPESHALGEKMEGLLRIGPFILITLA